MEEIIAVMGAAGDDPEGRRLRGMIVMLWRAGLRISEALALNETDLDSNRGAVLIRHGKGHTAATGEQVSRPAAAGAGGRSPRSIPSVR